MKIKIIKFLVGFYYRLYIVIISFSWVLKTNLGDKVIYDGKEYIVSNGVKPESWRLAWLKNDSGGWVKRKDCVKVRTLDNYIRSYMSGYRFYMTSWHSIWVNCGILPWMRRCNIWK